jgi:Tol biopolymer transport system component/DNA-binding winged helix-turn-helix (wHTH) protein
VGEQINRKFKFGPFLLDPAKRLLLREGRPVELTPKVVNLLLALVERRGELVEKQELMRLLWGDTFVEESNLTTSVSALRKALGENGPPHQYIKTEPKRGYRFIAEAVEVSGEELEGPGIRGDTAALIGSGSEPQAEGIESAGERARLKGQKLTGRARLLYLVGGVSICIAVASLSLYGLLRLRNSAARSHTQLDVVRVTASGDVTSAAISPDGKYVVYALASQGRQSLWIRQTSASASARLVPPSEDSIGAVTFAPDGSSVYYTTSAGVYRLPVLGGEPRRVADGTVSGIAVSPDGRNLAYMRREPDAGESVLFVAGADGSGERRLAARKRPESFYAGPSWSPDGKFLAVVTQGHGERAMKLVGVRVESGEEELIHYGTWDVIQGVAWLPDGSGLVVSAREAMASLVRPVQLWRLTHPGGRASRITNDLNDHSGVSLAADGRSLITVQSEQRSYIWVVPVDGPGEAVQVTSGREYARYGLAWEPGGRIVFPAFAGSNLELWVVGVNLQERKLITDDSHFKIWPTVSPDGRFIVFASGRPGGVNLWRTDFSGGNAVRMTGGEFDNLPQYSPDGRWVAYVSQGRGGISVWKLPAEGGTPVQLAGDYSNFPAWSPDGKLIACALRVPGEKRLKIAIIPSEGGEPLKMLDLPPTGVPARIRWTPAGDSIAFIDTREGVSNIWALPVDGGPPRRLTDFTAEQILFFDWSKDGRQLAVARYTMVNDVVMISNVE